jgi:predicted metalloendopeptidase
MRPANPPAGGTQTRPGQPTQPERTPPLPAAKAPASTPAQFNTRFDVANLDTSTDPCVDFYQYACGGWMKNNPIPPDQSRWGRFQALAERNREILREILEDAAKPAATRDAVTRQIGDFYAACMDERSIETKGLAPLKAEMDRIAAIADKGQLAEAIARMHRDGVGSMFDFGSVQDYKNSSEVIAQIDQGGLGLPDRDYYLNSDAKSVELRDKYAAHVRRMFELSGLSPDRAKTSADAVMRLETALAKGSLDRVSRRDPEKLYHRMTRQEVAALAPAFRWERYFEGSGAPAFTAINVAWPDFFKAINAEIEKGNLDDWKAYLTWHLLHSEAPLLPQAFVNENFNFWSNSCTDIRVSRI